MNKKLVILGKLESKYDAPFDNEEYDIWAFNKHDDEEFIPRVDKWFDIHQYQENITKPDADVLAKDFPFDKCEELVGGKRFCSSMSYIIAYAVLQGYDEILLYGSRFSNDHSRRERELHNVREMIWFCWGRGIKVDAPSDSEYLIPKFHVVEGIEFDQ